MYIYYSTEIGSHCLDTFQSGALSTMFDVGGMIGQCNHVLYVFLYIYVHSTYIHTCVHSYVYVHTVCTLCRYVHMYLCIYVCMPTDIHACIYTQTHLSMYTYVCIL